MSDPVREALNKLGRFFKFWVGSSLHDATGDEIDLEEPYEAFRVIHAALAATPAQEPVAWAWRDLSDADPGQAVTFDADKAAKWPHIFSQPLYTHPAAPSAAEVERLRRDAERYRWLRSGNYPLKVAQTILNGPPHCIDAAVDVAMAAQQANGGV